MTEPKRRRRTPRLALLFIVKAQIQKAADGRKKTEADIAADRPCVDSALAFSRALNQGGAGRLVIEHNNAKSARTELDTARVDAEKSRTDLDTEQAKGKAVQDRLNAALREQHEADQRQLLSYRCADSSRKLIIAFPSRDEDAVGQGIQNVMEYCR